MWRPLCSKVAQTLPRVDGPTSALRERRYPALSLRGNARITATRSIGATS
jgi:hypothetical protein